MKETFNVGDRVIIHKPPSLSELPCWNSDMDIFDGKECVIRYLGEYTIKVTGSPLSYSKTWCEKVEEMELQDDGQAFEAYITGWEVK